MKTLILYYSKSGHTRDLAAAIHKVIGGDMSELKSQRKYSSSYGMTILQAWISSAAVFLKRNLYLLT
jgi:flavodoxin